MRITVTVKENVVKGIDDFACYTKQSRSSVVSALLELSIPVLDEMRKAFDLVKAGADEKEVLQVLRSMSDDVSKMVDDLGVEIDASPRSCNNGGQVVASEGGQNIQETDFKGFSGSSLGGDKNA